MIRLSQPIPKTNHGFSIVEMLISMAVSIVFLFGLIQFFDATQRNKNIQFSKSQIQERGRIAAELMAQDIRMMDFWGCDNSLSNMSFVLNQNHSNPNFQHLILDGQSPLSAINDANGLVISGVDVVEGSDSISMLSSRSFVSVPQVMAPVMSNLDDPIQLSVGVPINQGDGIIISDCQNADLFTNTHTNTVNDGIVRHEIGALAEGIENMTGNLSSLYGLGASISRVYAVTYFVGASQGTASSNATTDTEDPTADTENPSAENSNTGNVSTTNLNNTNRPTSLYRTVNGRLFELVRGVSDLQLFYGIDDDQDGAIDRYTDGSAADLNMAIVVRAEFEIQSDLNGLTRPFIFVAGIRNRNLN